MIDKNGKLFGKINIIDLLIVLAILAAALFFATRSLRAAPGAPAGSQKVRITFFSDEAYPFLPDFFEEGAPITDYDSKLSMGTLSWWEVTDALDTYYDPNLGRAVEVPNPEYAGIRLTTEVYGTLAGVGLQMDEYTFVIGGHLYLNVGPTRTRYRIESFEVVG